MGSQGLNVVKNEGSEDCVPFVMQHVPGRVNFL